MTDKERLPGNVIRNREKRAHERQPIGSPQTSHVLSLRRNEPGKPFRLCGCGPAGTEKRTKEEYPGDSALLFTLFPY